MNLSGKTALITGGANGIGEAITYKLSSLGATVIINYNTSAIKATNIVKELILLGRNAKAIQCNISKHDDALHLIEEIIDEFGKIDIVVNNAGITKDNLIIRMNEIDFDDVIETNLKGTWNVSKHAARFMSKARSGKIINISSVVGITGNAGQTNYAASKAGIIGLTKSLARELGKRGVTCNAVAPGFIETKMTENFPLEFKEKFIENIPLGRLGTSEDVANVVAFLASDEANYITGQVIHVDGGLVMY
ncbi:MAG: 3-oxoacyl-[acyl-carrier-protein] reductase [Firmicutes bacterium]|nr:3-oxoacyl-[acyl-carrier-protein] reductase [Bacillota bacterium]